MASQTGGELHLPMGQPSGSNKSLRQVAFDLLRVGSPISASLIMQSALQLVTLSYAGTLGDASLAVAGLGFQMVLVAGLGIVFMACSEALSTLATQAYGANRLDLLPAIWQRAIIFNFLHLVPVAALLLSIPSIFHALGRDPVFTQTLRSFLIKALPLLPLQAVFYPLHNMLIAQTRTVPIMWMSGTALLTTIFANHVFVVGFQWGLSGCVCALVTTYSVMVLFLVSYSAIAGLSTRVWGARLERQTARQLLEYCSLGYSSMGMRALEFYAYTYLTVLAGFLPNPEVTQAAAAVGIECTGIAFVPFMGLSLACTTLVGNELGSNNPEGARRVARAAPILHPFVLVPIVVAVWVPASREYFVNLLAKNGSEELRSALAWLLGWVSLQMCFDGMQVLMGSVLTGCGLQRLGLRVNLVVFPFITMPLVFLVAKVLGFGLQGMFYSQLVAPIIQMTVFGVVVARLKWGKMAQKAQERAGVALPDGEGEPRLDEPLLGEKGAPEQL